MRSLITALERNPLTEPADLSPLAIAAARATVAPTFQAYGLSVPAEIIRHGGNAKLERGDIAIAGLTLTPAIAGPATTCANFRHCADLCVLTHGRGAFPNVRNARAARVQALLDHPDAMAALLAADIDRMCRRASRAGTYTWGLRLNVASDLAWETVAPWLVRRAVERGALVYDYTKRWTREPMPMQGYRLTFSAAGHSVARIQDAIDRGRNVAVVFADVAKSDAMPAEWHGMPVLDGDVHDVRYVDPVGHVVGLRAKGKAIHSRGTGLLYRVGA